MKIIPPYQITSEILNLINTAEKFIVLVSPYVNFNKWERIQQDLKRAKEKGVKIVFITRYEADNNKSWEAIEALGIQPKLVKNLHAKVYYNEKQGIVTSMNLLTSSNLNAIEFGSIYDTQNEINELKTFVKDFLVPYFETELPNDEDIYIAKEKFVVFLQNSLYKKFKKVSVKWIGGGIKIYVSNNFSLEIDKVKRKVYFSSILSTLQAEKAGDFIETLKVKFTNHEIELCTKNYNSIEIESKKSFTSDNFNYLKVYEKKQIAEYTGQFIDMILDFKEWCYQNREK